MMIKKLFGKKIQEIRKRQKFSQEQVAEKAGISTNYLSRIECGKENPTFDMLVKLSAALKTDLSEMFDFGHHVNAKELKSAIFDFTHSADEQTLRIIYQMLKIVYK